MLMNHPADVLILLNCCYAGNAAMAPGKGKNELIAAASADAVAFAGPFSFPKALMNKLIGLSTKPFTVTMLHRELASDFWQLQAQPLYVQLTPANTTSIIMPNFKAIGASASVQAAAVQPPASSVWIQVELSNSVNVSVEEWELWLRSNVPRNIESVKFHTGRKPSLP